MKEFNYKRAWNEWINPEFEKLMLVPQFQAAWGAVVGFAPALGQIGASIELGWCSESPLTPKGLARRKVVIARDFPQLLALLDYCDSVSLDHIAYIVNNYGHWGYRNECSTTQGATWKFRNLCMMLITQIPNIGEAHRKLKFELEAKANTFMDHKPGTSYNSEEVVSLLAGVSALNPVKHAAVNFRVDGLRKEDGNHPFCITGKHLQNSESMHLDPDCAPCGICGNKHSAHHHDMALLVDGTKDLPDDELKTECKKLVDFIEQHNKNNPNDRVKVDSFGLYDRRQV